MFDFSLIVFRLAIQHLFADLLDGLSAWAKMTPPERNRVEACRCNVVKWSAV